MTINANLNWIFSQFSPWFQMVAELQTAQDLMVKEPLKAAEQFHKILQSVKGNNFANNLSCGY
jgi:hypothetical protein